MLAMTDRGVNALLSPSVRKIADSKGRRQGLLGSAPPRPRPISARTSWSISTLSGGLYASVSLTGAVVACETTGARPIMARGRDADGHPYSGEIAKNPTSETQAA